MNKHLNQDISKTEKLLILDFDGVLVDSFEASMIAFKEIARRKNVVPLSENEIRNIATQGLFNRLKIKWWQIPYYISIARKIVKQNSSKIKILKCSVCDEFAVLQEIIEDKDTCNCKQ